MTWYGSKPVGEERRLPSETALRLEREWERGRLTGLPSLCSLCPSGLGDWAQMSEAAAGPDFVGLTRPS